MLIIFTAHHNLENLRKLELLYWLSCALINKLIKPNLLQLLFHCNGQNNAFIPKVQTKVKTLPSPADVSATLLPTAERELWGLKLWQVVGIFLTGTIVIGKDI